jgi:hypothetical protein
VAVIRWELSELTGVNLGVDPGCPFRFGKGRGICTITP